MRDDATFLRSFYQALSDRPLEPDDAWYVDLYHDPDLAPFDPVEQLATGIEWSGPASTHLFSGFRGTGKSTELRRLRARLREGGAVVVLCDMSESLDLANPVDIADFLVAVAGAFGDALASPDLLGSEVPAGSYWSRLLSWLQRSHIELDSLGAGIGSASLRANIRQDPTFRERLRERMEGHLGALVDDVQDYIASGVRALAASRGEGTQVVLLLDSIEQIRGTTLTSAEGVYASVEGLFSHHAARLHFPGVHVVYTVPPWLKIRSPGIAGSYGGMQLLPCVRVRSRDGRPWGPSLDALERLIHRRGDWARLLGNREQLDRICLASGGYLRDLFRILQSCLRLARNRSLPLSDDDISLALAEVRSSYLPLPRSDALWLAEVQGSQRTGLDVHEAGPNKSLYQLSRFFDTHMILGYRSGEEWYDVHPLLRDEVDRLVAGSA